MFTGRAKQLTIFIGETDHYSHEALYIAVVEMLRREGCGGATATRGITGFGASTVIHTSGVLKLSMDLPIVITVVDRPERIERILAPLQKIAPNALITVRELEVVQSGAPFKEGLPDVNVAEVMSRQVVTVGPDSPVPQVVELLLDKGFTAVPVVAADRKVVGIISADDLLRRGGIKVSLSLQKVTDSDFVRELRSSLADPGRKVSAVMTAEVVSVPPDMGLGQAAKLMVAKHLKRLPVVDKENRLVGILGRLDILNTIAAVHLPQWHPAAYTAGAPATVGNVMSREVSTVQESASLEEVFQLIVSSSHKRVVVVDGDRHVVGIITDSDLIARVSRENWPGLIEILVSKIPIERVSGAARQHIQKLRGRSAKELMTPTPITVREEMPVGSALVRSAETHTKRLPVVDADARLVGIVGRTELLRALLT